MYRKYSIIIILLFLSFSSCGRKDEDESLDRSEEIDKPISVKTLEVSSGKFVYLIECTGKIRALRQVDVTSEANGTVDISHLRTGAMVSANDLLIGLDSKSIDNKLARAKENLFNSKLEYQSELLSQESLLKTKNSGIRDTIYRKLKISSGFSSGEIELKELTLELQNRKIVAPFSGKLVNIKIQKGSHIKSGELLFTIFTPKDLFLDATITESDIDLIKIGDTASIQPIATSEYKKAVVSEINPIINENGLVYVKLKVLEPEGLMPGMNATATIEAAEKETITIPKESIVLRNNKPVVFVMSKNRARWIYVKLGKDNGKVVEIKEGLKVGDKLIISNNMQLGHDALVTEEQP